jgi:hypothetical protein
MRGALIVSFLHNRFDRQAVDLMTRAVGDAWSESLLSGVIDDANLEAVHAAMVLRVMDAVCDGERDQKRLELIALQVVDGRQIK